MKKGILLFLFILLSGVAISQELKVATNFESGSARVLSLDRQTQTIRITPAGNPKRGIPTFLASLLYSTMEIRWQTRCLNLT
jgi:hypothetical protein